MGVPDHPHCAVEPVRPARDAAYLWGQRVPDGVVVRSRSRRKDRSSAMTGATRREVLLGAGAASALLALVPTAKAEGETETHGLSSFGDLALAPDFKHFAYVNPAAPKGGILSLQIK